MGLSNRILPVKTIPDSVMRTY